MINKSNTTVDAAPSRHASPYSLREKVARVLWSVVEITLFRCTWPTWYRYRAWLLRLFGAKIHPTARVRRTCRFTCPWNLALGANTATGDRVIFYCLGLVTVGDRVTVSQDAYLCAGTHDYTTIEMPLLRPPIRIGDDAWVAAGAFVGPGVAVGAGAILGARGVAFKDLEAWTIYAGNPAQRVKVRPRFTVTPGAEQTGRGEPA